MLTQTYVAILNSDLLHGTMYHPTNFHADSWIILVVAALLLLTVEISTENVHN